MGGKKRIVIRNKAGKEIGAFYCPSDAEAIKRYAESMERYKKSVMPLICINIEPDGTTTTKSGKRIIITTIEKFPYVVPDIGTSCLTSFSVMRGLQMLFSPLFVLLQE